MSHELQPLGKTLLAFGALIALAGFILLFSPKFPLWLGRLPGDIRIEKPGFSFYFPLATSLLLSAALSLILWIIGRFRS